MQNNAEKLTAYCICGNMGSKVTGIVMSDGKGEVDRMVGVDEMTGVVHDRPL